MLEDEQADREVERVELLEVVDVNGSDVRDLCCLRARGQRRQHRVCDRRKIQSAAARERHRELRQGRSANSRQAGF